MVRLRVENYNVTKVTSAGLLSGGLLIDAGSSTVNAAAGTGLIRKTNANSGDLVPISWAESLGIAIPADEARYIGIIWNGGTPIIDVRTTDVWNYHTEFPLGCVVRDNGNLHITNNPQCAIDCMAHVNARFFDTEPLERGKRTGGLIIDETGARYVTLTEGILYDRTNTYPIADLNTSISGGFDTYVGDTPEAVAQTQWDNINYNDEGVLTELALGKWATLWWYLEADGDVVMLYGTVQHNNQASAELESEPSLRPLRVTVHATLIGRTVFQKSAVTSDFQSKYVTVFAGAGSNNHRDLSNLTDGDAGHTQFPLRSETYRNKNGRNIPAVFNGLEKFGANRYAEKVSRTTFNPADGNYISALALLNGHALIAFDDEAVDDAGTMMTLDVNGTVVVDATVFTANATTYIDTTLLLNGNFAVSYIDADDGNKVKFVIYDENLVQIVAPYTVYAGQAMNTTITTLQNGDFALAYTDNDDGNHAKFFVFSEAGVQVKGETTFSATSTNYPNIATLTNGYIVFAYATGAGGKYLILSADGTTTIVSESQFESDNSRYVKVVALTNGTFLIAYQDDVDNDKGKCVIISVIGGELLAPFAYATTNMLENTPIVLLNGNVLITYKNNGTPKLLEYVILDVTGKIIQGRTIVEDNVNIGSPNSPVALINGNVLIPYADTANRFVIHEPSPIPVAIELVETVTISNDAEIEFTELDDGYLHKFVFENVICATDDVYIGMRISRNGGSSYIAGAYRTAIQGYTSQGGAASVNADSVTEIYLTNNASHKIGNVGGENYCGIVECYNPSATTSYNMFKISGDYMNQSGKGVSIKGTGAATDSAAAYDAIKFYANTGNLSTGTIKHYRYL